ncbi:hypothetical protein C0J08_12950 [Marinomonas sp. CT5]|uniref:hypothetical protein n=1 Tax=Marinomonas sp. CT5 TaxID=2066133 RepID=UPI001BAF6B7F|nr:hypothetical protein [Marinomonas sp. CT5]QUX96245.1 hypothetical protein C0J08_12950 [Marinomonas sp. CT5]
MRYLLGLTLLLISISIHADSCRDQFVQCVQTTGNPATCRSSYQNCTTPSVIQSPHNTINEKLYYQPSIRQENGQSMLQLSVTNNSESAVQLDSVSYQVRCADESVEIIRFHLGGIILPSKEPRVIGQPQVACFARGGVVAMLNSDEAPDQGVASMQHELIYTLDCHGGKKQTLTLKRLKKGVYQWKNSQKSKGIINKETILNEDFIKLACEPFAKPNQDLMSKIINQLKQLTDEHDSQPKRPTPPKENGIGVRG